MPNSRHLTGIVTHVFAHRFVLKTTAGDQLADLGPKAMEKVKLVVGDEIKIDGEQKPSELKVTSLRRGAETFDISHPSPKDKGSHHPKPAEFTLKPESAVDAARKAGLEVIGRPIRKPRHFEILARKGGDYFEVHIGEDEKVRKQKPTDETDEKWQSIDR